MNDIDKNRPVFTINHIQTAPIKTKGKARSDIAEDTAAWLKDKKNKITEVPTGFSNQTPKAQSWAHSQAEEITCNGCSKVAGKEVLHVKSEFTSSGNQRGFYPSCKKYARDQKKASEAKLAEKDTKSV